MPAKKQYYIVKKGRKTGVFYSWADCQPQVQGFGGAIYKGFVTREEAEKWYGKPVAPAPARSPSSPSSELSLSEAEMKYPARRTVKNTSIYQNGEYLPKELTIFTDGSCLVNPRGPGGFAAVFLDRMGQELLYVTGGEPSTTNNRMELRAAYEALKVIDDGTVHHISFCTDSKYLQQGIMNHWLQNWKRNGWKTQQGTNVRNPDLWKGLDEIIARHQVRFEWTKGHVGTKYNEICDRLAKGEAEKFQK